MADDTWARLTYWERFTYLLTTNPEFYLYSVLALFCVVGLIISFGRLVWLLYEELRYAWYRHKRAADAGRVP